MTQIIPDDDRFVRISKIHDLIGNDLYDLVFSMWVDSYISQMSFVTYLFKLFPNLVSND